MLFLLAIGVAGVVAGSAFAGPTGPAMTDVVQTQDTNADGWIDAVLVTFDTPMDTAVAHPAGFSVEGFALRTPETQWVCAQNPCAVPSTQLQVYLVPHLEVAGGDTDKTPKVTYTPPAAGGARSAGTNIQAVGGFKTPKDAAKPALIRVTGSDFDLPGLFGNAADRMDLTFSEPVHLAGATASDRHLAIERAFKFSQGAGCQASDGDGVNIHNFPRAGSGATAQDPILVPAKPDPTNTANPNPSSRFIRVMMTADAGSSGTQGTNFASNIPGICKIGVVADGASNITDLATPANSAATQDMPVASANRRDINVADAELVYVDGKPKLHTRDLVPDPGNGAPKGDGILDTIEIVFDHEILDSSVTNALASQFAVFNGTQAATISSVTTPAAASPDQASVFLHLTNVAWDGQTTPKVWFDPGSSCALRTKIPTDTYYACAAAFGIVEGVPTGIDALDRVAPVLQTATTVDSSPTDGIINRVELHFNEPVAAASTVAGWKIGTADATAIEVVDADRRIVRLDFAPGTTPNTGVTPAVSYTTQATGGTLDADGNQIGAGTLGATDGAAPVLVKATSFDTDTNGKIDTVTFEFSEAVNQGLALPGDFQIDGAAASAFGTSPIDATNAASDNLVTVTSAAEVPGTGHVEAKYDGANLGDLADIKAAPKTIGSAEVIDGAKPVATVSTTPSSPLKAGTIAVRATFTEVMDTTVAPTVAIGPKAVTAVADDPDHNDKGWVDAAPNAGLIWDGSIELTSAECEAENGCALQVTLTGGKDPANNPTADLVPVAVVLDANAPDAATGEAVIAVQKAGFAPIAANTIGSNTIQLTLTAGIVAGQVNEIGSSAGGSAEIVRFDATTSTDQSLSPVAKIEGISSDASQVTITTSFANPAALQAALAEGTHLLKVKLCDGALMCATSSGVGVTADYTPVTVSLDSPNSGTLQGNSKACITWNADEANASLQNVKLRSSTDGGSTYPNVIATGLPADGAGACDGGSATGYGWTVPLINTTQLRIQVATLDSFNNEGLAASAEDVTVQTTYVLTHVASPTVIVSGGSTTLSGTFKGNDVPAAGRTITIQRRLRGQTVWQPITNVTTNANGAYSWSGRPGSTADYRAVSVGGNGYPALSSGQSNVAVRVLINFAQSATSLRRGQTVTFSGNVVPAKGGKKVQLLMLSGRRWVKVAETTLSSSGGYRFTYRLATAGTRTFKVYYAAQDIYHAGNSSIQRNVRWT